ncbi:MAG: hypothetical protein AAF492_07300, partial [Verrucomicrobiota bacterium]
MLLDQIQSNLKRQTDPEGNLGITSTDLPSGDVTEFIAKLPGQMLNLSKATVELAGTGESGVLKIQGNLVGDWPVLGRDPSGLSDIPLALTVRANGTSSMVSSATLEIASEKVKMEGEVENAGLAYQMADDAEDAALDFGDLAKSVLGSSLSGLLPKPIRQIEAGSLENVIYEMAFGEMPSSSMMGILALDAFDLVSAKLNKTLFGSLQTQALKLDNFGVFLESSDSLKGSGTGTDDSPTDSSSNDEGGDAKKPATLKSYGAGLGAKIAIGRGSYIAYADITQADEWTLGLRPADGDTTPTLDDFAGLLGGASYADDVKKSLSDIGIERVSVVRTEIRISDLAKAPHVSAASIEASLTIAGANLDVSLAIPDLEFSGKLAEDNTMSLSTFFANLTGYDAGLPDILITELSAGAQPVAKTYTLSQAATDSWTLDFAGTELALTGVGEDIEVSDGEVSGSVSAGTKLGGIDFFVSADHPDAADAGWIFDGHATSSVLDLNKLAQGVSTDLGISLPVALPALKIVDLNIHFETETRNVKLSGDIEAGSVEMLSISHDVAEAQFDMEWTVDASSGKHVFAGTLLATISVGGANFALELDLGAESDVISGSWNNASEHLKTSELVTTFLGTGDNVIPDLDIDRAALVYNAT